MPERGLPSVSVLALGGTIAATGASGVAPTLSAQQLVSAVPDIGEHAHVAATTFRQVGSAELTLLDIIALAREIDARVAQGDIGVVVTQGTDTIEETAFALDLLVNTDAPVIVTGAMRNPQTPGADGPANLLAAVRTALSGAARGIGTLVVFADQIHAARFVRKVDSQLTSAFRSSPAGPIGWLAEGTVRIGARPVGRYHLTLGEIAEVPPVALLTFGSGDEGFLINAVSEAGYRGLIVEGMGGGHVPGHAVPSLQRLARTMPVVLASRTGEGEALRRTYAFGGSEIDLLSRGLICAGSMTAARARVFLRLVLAANSTLDQAREAFDAFSEPGDPRLLLDGRLAISGNDAHDPPCEHGSGPC